MEAGKNGRRERGSLDPLSGREDENRDEDENREDDEGDSENQGGEAGKVRDEPQAHSEGKESGTHDGLDKSRDAFPVDGGKKTEKAVEQGDDPDDDDEHRDQRRHLDDVPDEAENADGDQGRGENAFRPDDALVLDETDDEIDQSAEEKGDAEDDIDDVVQRDGAAEKDADDKKNDALDEKHRLLIRLEGDRILFLGHGDLL